ncbi:MAG: FtsQ-type POTRA domain-containing protein, partial [Candidatus Hydrogenedentes bacterium]|nr:FtsQ-type POTRA domain-containing protein [Candidatus Hydrogenedentota bacterium]
VFVYAFYHYTIDSPHYKVNQILVYGSEKVSTDEVCVATGVTTEDNLLMVSTSAIAAKVAELPYVETVAVSRELPSTLVITLQERAAVATVMAGRRTYLVDGAAYVLRELPPGAPVTGPLITSLPNLGIPTVGERLNSPALHEALALWRAYSEVPVASEVTLSEISAEGPMKLTMFWDEVPYEVRWGRSDYRTQAMRLSALWRKKAGQLPCLEYLDLRFDQDLVCR